jgi:diguanylate cyclase (GGDEF)-like protein
MSTAQRSLLLSLHRANLRTVAAFVLSAWVAITVIAYLNLRVYGDQSLKLVAHSIGYGSNAAMVFQDAAAARERLALIGAEECLASASIESESGQELARFERQPSGILGARLAELGDFLFPQSVTTEIRNGDRVLGSVTIRGNSALYVEFFGKTLAAALLCLIGVGISIGSLSREVERQVVGPLNQLAALTHVVRVSRQFDRRAPAAEIAEINQLGDDFNALLAELENLEKDRAEHAQTLQLANERLGHQIRHDALTGLPNRSYFRERLAQGLASASAIEQSLAVLYVDYDNFKSVNDQFGHAAGDELLIEAGRRIRSLLRDTDTVARLGGDEFGVLLAPAITQEEAERIAARVVAVMHEPIELQGARSIVSSVSVGVALYPQHALTLERLLSAADLAMYRAKTEERNAYRVAESGEDANSRNVPRA